MLKKFGQLVVGLALLIALMAGLGWIVYTTITEAPAVVAAVVTAFGALFGVLAQRIWEAKREDEKARRERMAPIYEKLIEHFYRSAAGDASSEDLEEFFRDLAQGLLIWGAAPVVKAFVEWRVSTAEGGEKGSIESLLVFEKMMLAMRADLGHDDSDLEVGDLLRIFVNDLDEHLPEIRISRTTKSVDAAATPG